MSLFRLDASILPGTSASAELADLVESEWTAVHPDAPVARRHLGTHPLPADAWAHAHTGNLTPEPDRTPVQRNALTLARELTAELEAAEAVVLAVPLYNFGVSQHFKTWVDLIIAGAPLGSPVLKGKPVVLTTVRGGGYAPGTPREGWDHSTPYLKRILADVWQADLVVIERELTLATTSPGMEHLQDLAADLHAQTVAAARAAGREVAAR
ncbi:NAD(P)H-dependent oxidoreductase [Streptomyces venezuelae]|uniref:FMN-dependent NADH-azoreductase n=1 Tax=Streptomyces venezuelae TaxID=54571 RepID=UPI00341F5623